MHLSGSSRNMDQFRILPAVCKSLSLRFKLIRTRNTHLICFYIVSKIGHKGIFISINMFYMKYHLINDILLMLRNFFLSMCVLCLFIKRFEALYWPSLTNCQASCFQPMAAPPLIPFCLDCQEVKS